MVGRKTVIPFSFKYSITRRIQDAINKPKVKKITPPKALFTNDTALYRTNFISAQNRLLVNKAKQGDYAYFIRHLANQDYKYQKLWDDEYFENRFGMQKIYELIKQKNGQKLRILDIGCGNCKMLDKLKELGHEVYGIDLSALRVVKNRKRLKNIAFGYAEDIPFPDEMFDIVIAQEVLEHVFDLKQSLAEIKRVLKTGGLAYIQVPYLNLVESQNHLRLFSKETLNYWVNKYLKVRDIGIVPYKIGGNPNNIFLTAQKSTEIDVEFYLMDAFEIYHFLPLYKMLNANNFNAKFVCEPCRINVAKDWFDYDTAKSILEERGLKYSENANSYAEIAFTTQRIAYLEKYLNFKINFQYGAGLNKTNFCSTKRATEGFDARFVYGDYTKEKVKAYINENNIYEIGIPKHDEFFENPPVQNDIKSELNIHTDKKILVYFPTWDEDSSVSVFYDELKKLKNEYFVVTKAHHCTYRLKEKESDLKVLREISDIVLEGNYSFSRAAVLADIALIDAKSGAACEVPYLNPNAHILYLSVRDNLQEYFWEDIFSFGYLINKKEDLLKSLDSIADEDKFQKERNNKITYYLGLRDGKSTYRTLTALEDICEKTLDR